MKIKIDGKDVDEQEYFERVEIFDEDDGFCDEFMDLFFELGISPSGDDSIEELVDEVSLAYLRFIDFYDVETVGRYVN